ncbi:hypothetical protein H8R18_07850 [Nanchangia anserum]|uniref:Lipoprotein n=1 Tax=Nanchangia anserum TaxID=2692125 RepID=A0A8I0GG63_9ACTO|nr:hypothetical protein [Nanchangia anserum]MBD3689434.1 hypothetical protein [Nanchangia anserum]QOX81638.1 hypothetical protein H8R18_07850 [Nanchangia anserum]
MTRRILPVTFAACAALALAACTPSTPSTDASTTSDASTPAPSTKTSSSAASSDESADAQAFIEALQPLSTTGTPSPLPQRFGTISSWSRGAIVCPYAPDSEIPAAYRDALAKAGVTPKTTDSSNWLVVTVGDTPRVLTLPITKVNMCSVGGAVEITAKTTFVLSRDAKTGTITAAPVS